MHFPVFPHHFSSAFTTRQHHTLQCHTHHILMSQAGDMLQAAYSQRIPADHGAYDYSFSSTRLLLHTQGHLCKCCFTYLLTQLRINLDTDQSQLPENRCSRQSIYKPPDRIRADSSKVQTRRRRNKRKHLFVTDNAQIIETSLHEIKKSNRNGRPGRIVMSDKLV